MFYEYGDDRDYRLFTGDGTCPFNPFDKEPEDDKKLFLRDSPEHERDSSKR